MKTILSLTLAVAAIQLVSASVIRDEESTPEQTVAPASLQTPPVAPGRGTKVVAHVVEHTQGHDDEPGDKIIGYDPNVSHTESYIVSPEDKLYAEFADSPNADANPASQGSSDADEAEKEPELGALI